MRLRTYQESIFAQVVAIAGHDLVQLDTGAGKTPIIARLAEHYGRAVIVCHRNILIAQASDKLAACGVTHRILASPQTRRRCARHNLAHHGAHCINPRSTVWLVSSMALMQYSSKKMPASLICCADNSAFLET